VTTANQIIGQALGLIGVRSANDPVSGGDAALCFERLNTLLDALKINPLNSYATIALTGTLAANTSTLTIGPTGTIAVAERPARIESAFFTAGNLDYVVQSVTEEQYDAITLKAVSGLGPDFFYYEASLLNGVLSVYPRASAAITLTLQVLTQVSEFADLTTDYDLAPGYRRYFAYLLAQEVAPDFERDVPPMVARGAANARRSVQRMNHVVPQLDLARPPQNRLARIRAG